MLYARVIVEKKLKHVMEKIYDKSRLNWLFLF